MSQDRRFLELSANSVGLFDWLSKLYMPQIPGKYQLLINRSVLKQAYGLSKRTQLLQNKSPVLGCQWSFVEAYELSL